MATVRFAPNIPQQVALKHTEGRRTSGRRGERLVYTLTDGRQLSISMDLASKINRLEVNVNEPFCICKRWNGLRSQQARWDVWRTPEAEQARAVKEGEGGESELETQLRESITRVRQSATLVVPKLETAEAAAQSADDPSPTAEKTGGKQLNGHGEGGQLNGNSIGQQADRLRVGWAQVLLTQTLTLTDVYAAALDYSGKVHGSRLDPEAIRAMMITAFISLSQRGASKFTSSTPPRMP